MTSPQEEINKKITETKSVKDISSTQLEKMGIPKYVIDLQTASFEKRNDDLKKEREEIESVLDKETVIVALTSPGLPPGQISLRVFSLVLGGLQDLSDSIANTLYNQPSEKGKIPQEILDQNEFILKETRAGSFEAVLELKHPEQISIEGPVQVQTIAELFGLLESSNAEDNLAETISRLGPRTLRNYAEWTKSIKELNTTVDLEWFSSFRPSTKISFNATKAEKVHSILNDFSNTIEEEIEIKGKLTGANIRIKSFEIIKNDGEKITGRISKDAVEKIADFGLDKNCKADLLKVTVRGSADREKSFWTLRDIL